MRQFLVSNCYDILQAERAWEGLQSNSKFARMLPQ
jgi:hypothetical protein